MSTQLVGPRDLAKTYSVSSVTILDWYRAGKIPAEVAMGKVYRFDAAKVAKALAEQAKPDLSKKKKVTVLTHALVV